MKDGPRFAAIDVGSNAVRLIVARVFLAEQTFLRREAGYRVPLRLGEDVFDTGLISARKVDDLVNVFAGFRHLLDFFRPEKMRACATSAFREAGNGAEVCEKIWKETNIQLEIISGGEEAKTLFENHAEVGLDSRKDYLYIDVGGGSTELTLLKAGKVVCSESFRLGGVRILRGKAQPSEWDRMKAWIDAMPRDLQTVEAIGTGGNISKIYDMAVGSPGETLTRRRLREVVESIEKRSLEERIRDLGLKPDRADVIVPGGKVYHQAMKWADIKSMCVPKLGVADGVLAQMFSAAYGYAPVLLSNSKAGKVS